MKISQPKIKPKPEPKPKEVPPNIKKLKKWIGYYD